MISHALWFGAIATAIIEVVMRLASEPGGLIATAAASGPEIGVRVAAYLVLLALSLAMLSGRSWARWALLVIFGGLGTYSLVFEPVAWLRAGGDASAFLASADAGLWVIIASRVAHIACVWGAIVAMFLPSANAYFRQRRLERP